MDTKSATIQLSGRGSWSKMDSVLQSESTQDCTNATFIDYQVQCGSAEKKYHGEDAIYVDENFQVVADGVSGTKVSSAEFAKYLVHHIAKELRAQKKDDESMTFYTFVQSIEIGIKSARDIFDECEDGMSAALNVVCMDKKTNALLCFSVGDTKTIVIRRGVVVFESIALMHEFNVPATISTLKIRSFEKYAFCSRFSLELHDVILTCSDGVTDNLFKHEVADIVVEHSHLGADFLARELVCYSTTRSLVPIDGLSPFSLGAAQEYVKKAKSTSDLEVNNISPIISKTVAQVAKNKNDKRAFSKEIHTGKSNHYTLDMLTQFAMMTCGKKDDTSAAISILL